MRNIVKNAEPKSLEAHRYLSHADYESYKDKQSLRESLVAEQRGLCCYCMSCLVANSLEMKIEHWQSQERFSERQIDYTNLLGACLGGKGQPSKFQHCDTRKGDLDLSKNPADPTHDVERIIQYGSDGTIRSTDPVFNDEINTILNLNHAPRLKANRKATLDGFLDAIPKQGTWSKSFLEKKLVEWKGDSNNDKLKPFCQVVVYWLRKRLKQA